MQNIRTIIIASIFSTLLLLPYAYANQDTGSDNSPKSPTSEKNSQLESQIIQNAEPNQDPNRDPNQADIEPNLDLLRQPNADQPVTETSDTTDHAWQPKYHPQVTKLVFYLTGYPYYQGGLKYIPEEKTDDPAVNTNIEDNQPTENNTEPNTPADPNTILPDITSGPAQQKLTYALTQSCDFIHQWRRLNEAPATALEIVYAIELTKTSTHIYSVNPDLAVNVKRTIGQIRRLNQKFDATSRMIIQSFINNSFDEFLFSHLEKQLVELESLFNQLADQNDKISIALGVGKIDRKKNCETAHQPISYSKKLLPSPELLPTTNKTQ